METQKQLKSSHFHIKDCLALNNYFGILQPTSSSKPYILLSRNLMEGFRQHGDSETAKIIPFAYQRLPSTKQPFWNSSTDIFFQTSYPFEQKLDGRLHATLRLRNLKSSHLHIKDCLAINNYFGILQPTSSSKPYILLSRNLVDGFRQHGDSEIAIIIPFAYQRLLSTK